MTALAIALVAAALTNPCLAEGGTRAERAAAHFDTGLTLYQQGRMRDSASEFLTAFELAPHGDAMFNAGLAFDGAGDSAGAATAFAWALELGMRTDAAPEAKSRLSRLTPRLGTLRVTAAEDATVEVSPFRRRASPTLFYALPGMVLVSVTHGDGSVTARRVRVRARLQSSVDFDQPAPQTPARAPLQPPQAEPERTFPWRTVGWVSLSTGAAAGIGAVLLRQSALSAKDDYDASGHTDAAARQRALDRNRWTNVALVGAVALSGVGAGILVLHREPQSEVNLTAWPTGAAVLGRF